MDFNEYIDQLTSAILGRFKTMNNDQEKKLISIYSKAGSELVKKYSKSNGLTKAYLKQYTNSLYIELTKLMKEYNIRSAQMPCDLQQFILEEMAGSAKVNIKFVNMFATIPTDAIKTIISGDIYKDGKGLSKRLWAYGNSTTGTIQDIITTGMTQMKGAVDIAKDLEGFVVPSKRIYTGNKAIPGAGRIEYNALRLARTTNTHSYTVASSMAGKKNPYQTGLQWHTSASHSSRMHGKEDECDRRNLKVYALDDVPLDHPNGLCYQTPYFLMSLDEIGDDLKKWVQGGENKTLDSWFVNNKDKIQIH